MNYISDNKKLRIINAGVTQVTGKKIMIFGGLTEWPKISGSKQTGSLESSDEDESGNENY